MKEPGVASFSGLVDLACENIGGRALGASDDFFAGVENLLKPERAIFVPGKYTDRGKWMDGWESRRKRHAGHDFCIIELGARGSVQGFDIDTQHFVGNHPAFAEVHGLSAPAGASFEELAGSHSWIELLAQSALAPGSQNLFLATPSAAVSHLRLSIFPDGGVARLRAFGRVEPGFSQAKLDETARLHVAAGLVDLAALKHGARALACSDAHFGPMNNLLLPGRAENMGGGWETKRSRDLAHRDWVLIELGARGSLRVLEVDTQHFKGNFPDRCSAQVIDAPGQRITDLIASASWVSVLPEVKLQPDERHFFKELLPHPPVTHLRLCIAPDGGLSRLRAWGTRDA